MQEYEFSAWIHRSAAEILMGIHFLVELEIKNQFLRNQILIIYSMSE
jgi:hypothetical protein